MKSSLNESVARDTLTEKGLLRNIGLSYNSGVDYRKVIHDSWQFTHINKRVTLWLAFIPSLLWLMFGIAYVTYQYMAFERSPIFSEHDIKGFWEELFSFTQRPFGIGLLVLAAVIGLLYILLPTFFDAALIQYIARDRNGQKVRIRDAMTYGIFRYLPLLEYHAALKTFSFFAILTEVSFVMRNLGLGAMRFFIPVFLVIGIIGLILTLLFTYTDFFIVIDEKHVITSIAASCRLVIRHLQYTLLMTILMLLITIRIIVNIVFILAIPFLIFASASYFATITFPYIGYIVGAVLGLVSLFFATRLSASIHVFANTVWTYTFLELTSIRDVSAREQVAPAKMP